MRMSISLVSTCSVSKVLFLPIHNPDNFSCPIICSCGQQRCLRELGNGQEPGDVAQDTGTLCATGQDQLGCARAPQHGNKNNNGVAVTGRYLGFELNSTLLPRLVCHLGSLLLYFLCSLLSFTATTTKVHLQKTDILIFCFP